MFDRIRTSLIDSALTAYEGGDTLSIDSTDNLPCVGVPFNRYRMSNGLILEGNTYSLYNTDWIFKGAFTPVMGLARGMPRDAAERMLGRPYSRSGDKTIYQSERPTGDEADKFDSRWTVELRFVGDKLRSLRFVPSFDPC